MAAVNLLAMIHGIIPSDKRKDHQEEYNDLWRALTARAPELKTLFARDPIAVEWGHERRSQEGAASGELDRDERLFRAQEFINRQTAYERLRSDDDPNNRTRVDWGGPVAIAQRQFLGALREDIFVRGLGDAIYLSAPDGEQQIRRVVYGTILRALEPYADEPEVRIHLIGHSLGVTLCHDFLFGLFASEHESDFVKSRSGDGEEMAEERKLYALWKKKAEAGELKLGSLTSTASQLAILLMRSQTVVDRFSRKLRLQAADIGVVASDQVQWNLFYDIDDVLAYGTRRLYDNTAAIQEIQVDNNDKLQEVHGQYWTNPMVIEETAALLLKNSR